MKLPGLTVFFVFLREVFSSRVLRREPESALIIEDLEEVEAFESAGKAGTPLEATYLFVAMHASLVIQGSKKVLDLGCGPGTFLLLLAARHPETEFVGLDLSQPMLERAEANAKASGVKNVKFKKIDFSTLEGIPDASIDAVISTFAIHHLPSKKHLENLFVNAKRVLKSGGRLFIFDFGRLKTIQSVIHFAYRDRKRLPYLFTLDIERSIRASFLLDEFKDLGQKYFGSKVRAWGTFKVPLMIMVRSASQYLSESIRNFYRETRLKLTVSQRNDLDDLRAFFKLSGLSDDPFKVFFPENYFQARVKMIRMSSLGVQSFILIQRSFRLLILFTMFVRIGLYVFGAGAVKVFGNQEKAGRAERWANHKIGLIAAETLGGLKGAVMKFGQMLSFFPVGLPKEITGHLDVLQDSVIPLSGSSIKRQIEESLGRPITQLFSEWNDTPLAAASVGQVHFAKLMDGRPVAVKVKFRQIEEIIDGDLKNILLFAPWLKKRTGLTNVTELIDELRSLSADECDFKKAAKFQKEFYDLYKDDPDVIIPNVYSELCTNDILVMEYIEGETYKEFRDNSTQEERSKAGQILWKFVATSMNKNYLYNADPHPGNYLFSNGKICFLDFGFTKRYDLNFINAWKDQSIAGCAQDLKSFIEANRRLGYIQNESTFDHAAMMKEYYNTVYEPWGQDRSYKFTQDFVDREMATLDRLIRSQKGNRMPIEFVSTLRLLSGLHLLLADLQAEANWHQLVFPLILKKEEQKLGS